MDWHDCLGLRRNRGFDGVWINRKILIDVHKYRRCSRFSDSTYRGDGGVRDRNDLVTLSDRERFKRNFKSISTRMYSNPMARSDTASKGAFE